MEIFLYIIFLFVLILLISLSALFSFSEMAISSSSKTRLLTILDSKETSQKKKKKAIKVVKFIENYNEHITAIVIFNNIVNIMFSTLATLFFAQIASDIWGVPTYGALLSFLITTPLVILFGEIIPKQLAKKYPETGTMKLSLIIGIVNKTMKPFTFVLGKIIKEEDNAAFSSDEEINTAISQATLAGVTTEYEQSLIKKMLSADEASVESIMIPLEEVVAIPKTITKIKLNELIKKQSYTRFPVIDKEDNVISIFSVKNYLIDFVKGTEKKFDEYTYSFLSFNIDENPFHILEGLRSRREKMAIILNEKDEFVGIVTIEDIIELIVGEIYDETDIEEDGVYKLNDTSFILNHNVNVGYWISEYFSKLKVSPEIKKMNIEKWATTLKTTKTKHGDSITYKNLIIWVREDKYNKNKLVYEIDII